jgi:hypothetical protein
MVEYKKAVAVKYNNVRELHEYIPPRGIDLQCFELDDRSKQAMVQLICNSESPSVHDRRYKEELDAELCKLKIAIDNVTNHPKCPKGQQVRHETTLSSISNDMDYLRSRVKVQHSDDFAEVDIA